MVTPRAAGRDARREKKDAFNRCGRNRPPLREKDEPEGSSFMRAETPKKEMRFRGIHHRAAAREAQRPAVFFDAALRLERIGFRRAQKIDAAIRRYRGGAAHVRRHREGEVCHGERHASHKRAHAVEMVLAYRKAHARIPRARLLDRGAARHGRIAVAREERSHLFQRSIGCHQRFRFNAHRVSHPFRRFVRHDSAPARRRPRTHSPNRRQKDAFGRSLGRKRRNPRENP